MLYDILCLANIWMEVLCYWKHKQELVDLDGKGEQRLNGAKIVTLLGNKIGRRYSADFLHNWAT